MGRIATSWELMKASWKVLKADKELMLLPVLSAVVTLGVVATFIVPFFLAGGDTGEPSTITYVLGLLFYLVTAYVVIFFNAALVHAANERLEGGDPTLGSALRGAAARAGAILPWALLSATVSMILRSIEERSGFVGQIVASIAGAAWSLITYLVLPVLVIEGRSVSDALKASATYFKRTWGENVAAQIGFGIIGFVAALPGFLFVLLGVATGSGPAVIGGVVLGVIWVIGVSIVITALSGIFQTALYHYAATGVVPGGFFDEQRLRAAFSPRGNDGIFR